MDKIFAEFKELHLRIDELDQKVERKTEGDRGRPLRRPSVIPRRNGKNVVHGSVVPKDEEEVEEFEEEEEEEDRHIVRPQRSRYDDNLNSIKQQIPQFLGKHDPNAYIAYMHERSISTASLTLTTTLKVKRLNLPFLNFMVMLLLGGQIRKAGGREMVIHLDSNLIA